MALKVHISCLLIIADCWFFKIYIYFFLQNKYKKPLQGYDFKPSKAETLQHFVT